MALARNHGLQATTVFSVTPSDSTNIGTSPEGYCLYVGTTGNIAVDTAGGSKNVTFNAVPVGFFPVFVTRVYNTNTTASNILGIA